MKFGGTGVVTRQGQITLPKDARDEGEFEIGTIVEFFYSDDLVVIKKKKTPRQVFTELSQKTEERFKKRGIIPGDVQKEIEAYRREKK